MAQVYGLKISGRKSLWSLPAFFYSWSPLVLTRLSCARPVSLVYWRQLQRVSWWEGIRNCRIWTNWESREGSWSEIRKVRCLANSSLKWTDWQGTRSEELWSGDDPGGWVHGWRWHLGGNKSPLQQGKGAGSWKTDKACGSKALRASF